MSFFNSRELQCVCNRPECDALKEVTPALLTRLDALRYRLNRPVIITSGLRCEYQNAKVGGIGGSEHVTGEAADIAVPTSRERYEVIEANFQGTAPIFERIGVSGDFIHVGVSVLHDPTVIWLYST